MFDIGPSDELWVAEVRSNSERLVFDAGDLIGDVAWAPSGRAIAITFGDGIWLINPDGTGLRRIADSGDALAWSPDSKSLAFSRIDDRLRWHVAILSLETGEERVLSAGFDPRWSPDARFLLFQQASGRIEPPKIRLVRATGGAPRTVARGSSPSWSPDGRRIAFRRADRTGPPISLWVIDRNGSHRRRIASPVSASNWRPAWSPHARQIAFVKDGAGGCRSSAYVVPVKGGRPNRLARETREISPLGWFSRRRVLYQARRCQS
ncbi:MAG TPA: hypothetical protein VFT86_05030 [Gaiellaceae bacterium]|nr:hypothetical protein [Gaiellaceae bacterium]